MIKSLKTLYTLESFISSNKQDKVSNWWNDGESKPKKFLYVLSGWWNDGNNKLIKSIYVSLFLHLLFAVGWFLKYLLT